MILVIKDVMTANTTPRNEPPNATTKNETIRNICIGSVYKKPEWTNWCFYSNTTSVQKSETILDLLDLLWFLPTVNTKYMYIHCKFSVHSKFLAHSFYNLVQNSDVMQNRRLTELVSDFCVCFIEWVTRIVFILIPLMISAALIFGPPSDTKASNTL